MNEFSMQRSARAPAGEAVAQPIYDYAYEWDCGNCVHRSLDGGYWNGRKPDRSIPLYAAPQPTPERDPQGDAASGVRDLRDYKWLDPECAEGGCQSLKFKASQMPALDEERRKFQAETLRTSELSTLLRKWIERHEVEHPTGPGTEGCSICELVDQSRKLLERPINATPPAPKGLPAAPQAQATAFTRYPAPKDKFELGWNAGMDAALAALPETRAGELTVGRLVDLAIEHGIAEKDALDWTLTCKLIAFVNQVRQSAIAPEQPQPHPPHQVTGRDGRLRDRATGLLVATPEPRAGESPQCPRGCGPMGAWFSGWRCAGCLSQPSVKLWLWKNGDHYLAFAHEYPCFTPGGDPMTLGEPCGIAYFTLSHDRALAASPIATPEPQERKPANPIPGWMVALPCAMVKDRSSAQGAWLYIPHADGQWVSAAKLAPFSLAIIDAWRKERGIVPQDGDSTQDGGAS